MSPQSNIKGNFVIFGGTGGIGSELSRRLSKQGCRLVVSARDPEKTHQFCNEIEAKPFLLDAKNPDEVKNCIEFALEEFGQIHGVANCVGSLLLKPAHITSTEEWDDTIATNLTSAFAVVRSAAKEMMQSGGSIVLVSSCAARVGLVNHEAIAAAKAGVIGLTQAAAASYANKGIRINCVAPGLVRTPLTKKLTSSEAALNTSTAMHPLGRIGEPEDIAATIEWLLSPENSWITGQVISVDGGLAALRNRQGA